MTGDFFTGESISTLAGASFGVYIVCNVIQHVFGFNPKWLGLVLSIIFSLLGVYISNKSGINYVLAFLNGFLIYANTVGIVQMAGKKENQTQDKGSPYGASRVGKSQMGFMTLPQRKRTFFTKWY